MIHSQFHNAVDAFAGRDAFVQCENRLVNKRFDKLLHDVAWTYPQQTDPHGSGKFEWLSPDLARSVLSRLGFDIWMPAGEGRDIWLIATLVDVTKADALEACLRSAPAPHAHLI